MEDVILDGLRVQDLSFSFCTSLSSTANGECAPIQRVVEQEHKVVSGVDASLPQMKTPPERSALQNTHVLLYSVH